MKLKGWSYFGFIILLLLLIFYCIFHTVLSRHSIVNAAKFRAEISRVRDRIEMLQKKKERLELDRALIADEKSLDIDLLEEQARKKFGLMKKGEKVIYHDTLEDQIELES